MTIFLTSTLFVLLVFQILGKGMGCDMKVRGLDANMKKMILDLHNKKRQTVANGQQSGQPSAANMKELHWDDQIAANAQRSAETCVFQHTAKNLRKTSKYSYLGENIYMGSYPDPIPRSVNAWYDEVKDVTPAVVKSFRSGGPMIGHYTQMVWANTEALGCGLVTASDKNTYIFCQYGPSGNYPGEPIYKQGSPASDCKKGKSSKYPGLCN
uniref:Cysteine-rich venom protein n=1 Tax=Scolopendra subspinipes TaxID=55038 RepID=A0A5B8TW80_SCOSU|nr:venom allergen [Scolopendra subspinipes]